MNTKYDFDRIVPRENTGCAKWDLSEVLFGSKDVIPMWVADMDFPIAKEITLAIKKRADHEIYGYPIPEDSIREAVINRMKKRYNWDVMPEWIDFAPGIVSALYTAVKAYTHPGDEVVIQGPVYSPIWSAVADNGCQVANNQLKLVNGRYEIDYKDLEEKFDLSQTPRHINPFLLSKMMILCSPHNPVGRVWTRGEQIKIGEIITKNNAVMISDEIHAEVLYKDIKHIPYGSISSEFEQHSVTCVSPSKAFNLAGLGASAIIIPNAELRNNFNTAKSGIVPLVNCFGLTAMEAAYNHGDEWLTQFLDYLQANLDFLTDFIKTRISRITVIKPEGTYLVWLDCRALSMDNETLRDFIREKARLGLEDGFIFGPGGNGFQRINIGCPRAILKEALERLENAVNSL